MARTRVSKILQVSRLHLSSVQLPELLLSFAEVCDSSSAMGFALFSDEFLVGVTHDMTESRL
jgi:hypothetical protein